MKEAADRAKVEMRKLQEAHKEHFEEAFRKGVESASSNDEELMTQIKAQYENKLAEVEAVAKDENDEKTAELASLTQRIDALAAAHARQIDAITQQHEAAREQLRADLAEEKQSAKDSLRSELTATHGEALDIANSKLSEMEAQANEDKEALRADSDAEKERITLELNQTFIDRLQVETEQIQDAFNEKETGFQTPLDNSAGALEDSKVRSDQLQRELGEERTKVSALLSNVEGMKASGDEAEPTEIEKCCRLSKIRRLNSKNP